MYTFDKNYFANSKTKKYRYIFTASRQELLTTDYNAQLFLQVSVDNNLHNFTVLEEVVNNVSTTRLQYFQNYEIH